MTTINRSFTDEEIRSAILRASKTNCIDITVVDGETYVADYEVEDLRDILAQLFRVLPDEPGSIIQNVTDDRGRKYLVMSLDSEGDWCGVDADSHSLEFMRAHRIASWEPFEDNELND